MLRLPQIQALRAVAVIMVLLFHARFLPGGFIGVDIFYVISGYLITGLLVREIDATGRLNISAFYQRRIKRLLPTSFFVLVITALLSWLLLPEINRSELGRDLAAAAAYVSNYLFAWWQNDYQNLNATPSPFIHYWSLAVEEQFYLIWPILILILTRISRRRLISGIATITLVSFLLSVYMVTTAPIWAFYSLPTRAWELGVGALLIFLPKDIFKNRSVASITPILSLATLLLASFRFNQRTSFPGLNALAPVLACALLIATISQWPRVFNYLANSFLTQWLGKISYPLYLWHWPLLILPSSYLARELTVMERMLCIALTVLLAHLTNRFIEEPLRHFKITPPRLYLTAIISTVLCFGMGITVASSASSIITTKGDNGVHFNLSRVLAKPIIYSDGCHLNFNAEVSGICTYGLKSSLKTLVLFGDSHAAQWFPALEKIAIEKGFKLVSLTKSSCPSVDVERADQGAFKNSHCDKWRKNSILRIKNLHPTAVIMSSYDYYTPPRANVKQAKWWSDGEHKLLSEIIASSSHLIYIVDTPRPLRDIPSCLSSSRVSSCNAIANSTGKVFSGFQIIDPTPWLCSTTCPSIINSIVAYRDASHISVDMALNLSAHLAGALSNAGVLG